MADRAKKSKDVNEQTVKTVKPAKKQELSEKDLEMIVGGEGNGQPPNPRRFED